MVSKALEKHCKLLISQSLQKVSKLPLIDCCPNAMLVFKMIAQMLFQ